MANVKVTRLWVSLFLTVSFLTGCYYPPQGYDYGYSGGYSSGYTSGTYAQGGPTAVFTFSDGVQGYYLSTYSTYVYGYNGGYYRWIGDGWDYAPYYNGPWGPLPPSFYLPPLLVYGPPPPVVAYRPYFVWWRAQAGPWYAMHHPGWWQRHQMYVRHYNLWNDHVVRYYQIHPHYRPVMHPVFRRQGPEFDHRGAGPRSYQPGFQGGPNNGPRPYQNRGYYPGGQQGPVLMPNRGPGGPAYRGGPGGRQSPGMMPNRGPGGPGYRGGPGVRRGPGGPGPRGGYHGRRRPRNAAGGPGP